MKKKNFEKPITEVVLFSGSIIATSCPNGFCKCDDSMCPGDVKDCFNDGTICGGDCEEPA